MTFEEYPININCPVCGNQMNFRIDKEQTLEDIDKWNNCLDKQKVKEAIDKIFKNYAFTVTVKEELYEELGL